MQLALPLPGDDLPGDAVAAVATPPVLDAVPGVGDARARLRAAWVGGAPDEAGRALAAALDPDARPRWGADVLALLAAQAPAPIAGVVAAVALAGERARWPEAHDLALALDAQARRAERTHGAESPRALLLGVAACVARLAYASAGGLAPFAGDPAGRLTTLVRALVERASDPALEARAWRTLSAAYRAPDVRA